MVEQLADPLAYIGLDFFNWPLGIDDGHIRDGPRGELVVDGEKGRKVANCGNAATASNARPHRRLGAPQTEEVNAREELMEISVYQHLGGPHDREIDDGQMVLADLVRESDQEPLETLKVSFRRDNAGDVVGEEVAIEQCTPIDRAGESLADRRFPNTHSTNNNEQWRPICRPPASTMFASEPVVFDRQATRAPAAVLTGVKRHHGVRSSQKRDADIPAQPLDNNRLRPPPARAIRHPRIRRCTSYR